LYAFGNGNRKPSNPLVSGHAPLVARPRSEPPALAGGLCLIARTSYDLKINRPLPRAVLTHPCPEVLRRSESLAILSGRNECFYHFGSDEVAVERVQLVQPEFKTRVV